MEVPKNLSPIGLLHEGAKQIRSLFFREEENTLHLLGSLSKEFHAGCFVGLKTLYGDIVDLQWSKKQLKKVIIHPGKTRSIRLHLQKAIRSFRLRKHVRQKGERCTREQTLELTSGQKIYLDRFQR